MLSDQLKLWKAFSYSGCIASHLCRMSNSLKLLIADQLKLGSRVLGLLSVSRQPKEGDEEQKDVVVSKN